MIDFKNPAALRELINETARGPWERLDTPDYAEIWNGTLESPLALVDNPDNADFITISREALPYWMERAEAAERANKKLLNEIAMYDCCPPSKENCHCGLVPQCRACWREWAIKMERNKHE